MSEAVMNDDGKRYLTESEQACLIWLTERGGRATRMKNMGWLAQGEVMPFQWTTLKRLCRRGLATQYVDSKVVEVSPTGYRLAEILKETRIWI
jgi:predicted nuclease with RNAse H fold